MAAVSERLTDEECYLLAILTDPSGIDLAEFCWFDPETQDAWRAWSFQWKWFRCSDTLQIDQSARAVGKSLSIKLRAFAFGFVHPGQEMVITAPELVHLNPIIGLIERQYEDTRLGREMVVRGRSGVTHRPFQMNLNNGSRIIGRIPQTTGRGVKGIHPIWLEMDEAQDYPKDGWTELTETLQMGKPGAVWRAHGVTRGVQDEFYDHTQDTPDNEWKVHRIVAMARPNWTDAERQKKIREYGGSRDAPDYRRNILGLHGDATNPLFVMHRFMRCWLGSTLVETLQGKLRIDEIDVGHRVRSALGWGEVRRVIQSQHSRVVRIEAGGEEFVCSPEHRVFTGRGWVEAHSLEAGDEILTADEAVRGVWGTHPEQSEQAFLWERLHREVAWGDLPRLGYPWSDIEDLRMVWRGVLPAFQGDPVLRGDVRAAVAGRTTATACGSTMRMVSGDFFSFACDQSVLYRELSSLVGELSSSSTGEESSAPHAARRTGRTPGSAIQAMAGARTGLAAAVLDKPLGSFGRGSYVLHDRHSRSLESDRGGSRWAQSSLHEDERYGSGPVAPRARVDRVEVLERGDREFDRLSGGEDHLVLYDLTVAGHPSFAVGHQSLLSHNCCDTIEASAYNATEYEHFNIKAEMLEDRAGYAIEDQIRGIIQMLDFSAAHKSYGGGGVVWAGMDVGFTADPTEILVFVEYEPTMKEAKADEAAKRALPEGGLTRLRLLTRITLQRIGAPLQVEVIKHVVDHYRPRSFALDKTGNGLPLFQAVQASALPMARVIKGYNFSEKVIVDIDGTITVGQGEDILKEAAIKSNVLEYSTDCLRGLVDQGRLMLPFEGELIREFNGQTFSYSKNPIDQYGRRRRVFSQGHFHALDAARMAAMAHAQHAIEEFIEAQKQDNSEPVFDYFLTGV